MDAFSSLLSPKIEVLREESKPEIHGRYRCPSEEQFRELEEEGPLMELRGRGTSSLTHSEFTKPSNQS